MSCPIVFALDKEEERKTAYMCWLVVKCKLGEVP